ncbi:MAG: cytochrome C biogenesis protein [Candidatus Sedimenticola endophacoides]|uniref:Cytochrome C biogenesis protein n=1 Tax=Candidatus Sedimenticola endophacoides TaxID=2548426 RepID=A0A6N4DRG4_9GAMM|nr:MAG: cytochrome C biogenesis protein [Candidatus Sedimenticola endophacoides]OQX40129.1 MAG: cytochrome C biogenesis protein [Candidatus Sedimenticola endophacoides]PUD99716.1 MAG: cytochrome C biogenesis protein [Candidatus Sedimenticola endophacoides]PUE00342.1 MAG: cytochrome C biogenesis protein [Candidatus Sedimenticola endophacoides]PUE03382.1 MAG: cytochrome C biogenesis protein [Candidatus Sedimenticola endophacoides]
MQYKDYYRILGVERGAGLDEIKRAYRKLARKYHPDVSQEPDAEARFKEINEAHEVLKDPAKRSAYDQLGSGWRAGQEFRPPPGQGPHIHREFYSGGDSSDFFESLFGREFGINGGFAREGFTGGTGPDQHASIQVDLEDAYGGATRTVELSARDTPDRAGRKLKVRIPPGITEGQKIRLAGQGGGGIRDARRGDLLLEVRFKPHPRYTAEGRDITVKLPITPSEAVLGASVEAPTLGGPVSLKIPPGSQSGDRLRLKGRGLPGRLPGDQYVILLIQVPRDNSRQTREAYERLRQASDFNPRKGGGT